MRLTSFVAKKTLDSRGAPSDHLDVSKDEWNLEEEDNDLTDPSFLPMGSSRNTPDHSPGPNLVSPMNWILPGFTPST